MPCDLFWLALVFIPIRRSAGGFHAKSRIKCFLFSCFCEIMALLLVQLKIPVYINLVLLVVSDIVLFVAAPVDNEHKKMFMNERLDFSRKTKRNLIVMTLVSLIFNIFGQDEIFRSMVLGICLAAILVAMGKYQQRNITLH